MFVTKSARVLTILLVADASIRLAVVEDKTSFFFFLINNI